MEQPDLPEAGTSILAIGFLGSIVVITILGFTLASSIEPFLDGSTAWLMFGIFLLVAVTHTFFLHGILLPAMAKQGPLLASRVATIGFALAESPAIYGLVVTVGSGAGWRILPFTAIALLNWALVRGKVASLQAATSDEVFPRL